MDLVFKDKSISGVLLVVPSEEKFFIEEMSNFHFPLSRSLKLKEVMGYDRHRVVSEETTATDLVVFGMRRLFDENLLFKDSFDALIVVSQSPDFLMPSNSSVIQGKLDLPEDMLCLDLIQGCAGFLIGLFQAFMLLEQPSIKRVVLANTDVLSKKVSKMDRNSYPLIGDAASITIVENGPKGKIFANVKMDGRGGDALSIPAGGFKLPSTLETAKMVDMGDGNIRSLDNLKMDGSAVFNFVQTHVPPMIDQLFQSAGISDKDVDHYLFHQPNKFMLDKLAEKMNVDKKKMPSNVVGVYGNSSGVTIPAALVSNLANELKTGRANVCFAGFGAGLTWASMYLRVGMLDFCQEISYEKETN